MYKIEIWQRVGKDFRTKYTYKLIEVYEADDIQDILAWYKFYWYDVRDEGFGSIDVYKNGIPFEVHELWELGFYD